MGSLTTDDSQASLIQSVSMSVRSELEASGQLSGPPRLTQPLSSSLGAYYSASLATIPSAP